MEKLKKTARIMDRIARIFRVIFIVAAIICLVGVIVTAVYYAAFHDEADATLIGGDLHLTLGSVRLELTQIVPASNRPLVPLAVMLTAAAVVLALSAAEAGILHRILSPMAEGRPFDSSVSENLRKLGWMSLAQVLVFSLAEPLSTAMALRLVEFGYFLDPRYVKSYTVSARVELADYIIPAALFFLSWVFRYGEELQRQSDETL